MLGWLIILDFQRNLVLFSAYVMLEWLETHQLPCLFREIFGVICPGCGFQRALLLLLRGEVGEAFCLWPGLLPLGVFIILIIVRMVGIKKISERLLKNMGFVCLLTILISYLLKLIVKTY